MFTGIIEEVGHVGNIRRSGGQIQLLISAAKILDNIKLGDSVSINGICLTVTDFNQSSFSVYASSETVNKTTMSNWNAGTRVNLERALKPSDRFGGHFVQGHVDCTGTVREIKKQGESLDIKITHPSEIGKYFLQKGSVSIDGISLTINSIDFNNHFVSIRIIPATLEKTAIGDWKTGTQVNLETDMIGRHIVQYLESISSHENITKLNSVNQPDNYDRRINDLREQGF
jgi:riboflavin synthase